MTLKASLLSSGQNRGKNDKGVGSFSDKKHTNKNQTVEKIGGADNNTQQRTDSIQTANIATTTLIKTIENIQPSQRTENNALSFGSLEHWQISTNNNASEMCWFAKENSKNDKHRRLVFIQGKLCRIWDIDPISDTFQAEIKLSLTWLCTKMDYINYISIQEHSKTLNSDNIQYKPEWIPDINIINEIECSKITHEIGNSFHKQYQLINWPSFDCSTMEIIDNSFNPKHSKYNQCLLEFTGTFEANMNLQAYPLDIQDLPIHFVESSGKGLLTGAFDEKLHCNFFKVAETCFDPNSGHWLLKRSLFEFLDQDYFRLNVSDMCQITNDTKSQFVIRLKYARKINMYSLRFIFMFAWLVGMSLLIFRWNHDELGERATFGITLLLTLAFIDYSNLSLAYPTFLDKYVYCSYLYLAVLTIITEIIDGDNKNRILMWSFIGLYVFYHLCFAVSAVFIRYRERKIINKNTEEMFRMQQPIDYNEDLKEYLCVERMNVYANKPIAAQDDILINTLSYSAKIEPKQYSLKLFRANTVPAISVV